MRCLCLITSIILLVGCGGGDHADEAGPTTVIFRGLAVFGHEVRTFQLCGADSVLWAVDESGVLWDVHKELAPPSGPGAALFAVVDGRRGPAPVDGFGADFPGALVVTRVHYLGLEGPDCGFNWDDFQYRGVGNEPFWAVNVTADGMRLTRPGVDDLFWPAVTRIENGDELRFVGAGGDEHPIAELVVTPVPGRDTMSGSYFGWSATLEFDGEILRGRALVGAN